VPIMLSIVQTVLYGLGAILGFGFLVLIHELGHFWAYKSLGRPVHSFSIGFGSPWWRRTWRGTEYRLGWLPLGGYVMLEDPDLVEKREQAGEPLFPNLTPFEQIWSAIWGPLANVLATVALFAVLIGIWGQPTPVPVVDSLVASGAASMAGLQRGDRIVTLDGVTITSWEHLLATVQKCSDRQVRVEVERGGQVQSLAIQARKDGEAYRIGVRPQMRATGPLPWPSACVAAVQNTWQQTVQVVTTLARLFTGGGGADVAGPIAILGLTSRAVEQGWEAFITLLAILSINLAWFNLLPVPPLDGLRIMLASLQAIKGRPLDERYVLPVFEYGALALAVLFLLITLKDVGGLLFT